MCPTQGVQFHDSCMYTVNFVFIMNKSNTYNNKMLVSSILECLFCINICIAAVIAIINSVKFLIQKIIQIILQIASYLISALLNKQYHHLISIQHSNHNVVIQMITAKAWILIDVKQNRVLRGKGLQQHTEIASLTKMYTLYSCLTLNQTLRNNPQNTVVKTFQTSITGTSAKIQPNRYISLMDLYYALMLPSGNDAACILACYYGLWLTKAEEMQGQPKQFRKQSMGQRMKYYELYCKKFVHYMNNNLVKQQLKHNHTKFQNPHGLSDKNQVSTVSQLGQASLRFIKNETFRKICSCEYYQSNYYQSEDTFQWTNTNILLKQGYTGIKTGHTASAGGCLSSIVQVSVSKYEKIQLLIVLVGSSDKDSRFEQTRIIIEEYLKYLKMMTL